MFTHIPSKTYTTTVYVIERDDLIQHGLNGNDSKGSVDNQQRSLYLKQMCVEIFGGSGVPLGNMGRVVTVDTDKMVLYNDELTGALWMPVISGTTITSWRNITKNVVLNVKGLSLNNVGDNSNYQRMEFDPNASTGTTGVVFLDIYNELSDLRVRTILFDRADSIISNINMVVDNEIIGNNITTQQSENTEGGLNVGRVDPSTQIRNDSYFHFISVDEKWKCYDSQGHYLGMNIGGIVFDGIVFDIRITSEDELIIASQADFDTIFNDSTGFLTVIPSNYALNSIFLKEGVYTLTNTLLIEKPNFRIHGNKGAWIQIQMITGESVVFQLNAPNIKLEINLDVNNNPWITLFNLAGTRYANLKTKVMNTNSNIIFAANNDNIGSKLEYSEYLIEIPPSDIFQNISNSNLYGTFNFTGDTFATCNNTTFRGFINGIPYK